jgi:hypothetical protein
MKLYCLLFFLLPLAIQAQHVNIDRYQTDIDLYYKDSVGKPIRLPHQKGWDYYSMRDSLRKTNFRVISAQQYYSLFAAYHKDSLPLIDFGRYILQARIVCVICTTICFDRETGLTNSHRCACNFAIYWFLVERELIVQANAPTAYFPSQIKQATMGTGSDATIFLPLLLCTVGVFRRPLEVR